MQCSTWDWIPEQTWGITQKKKMGFKFGTNTNNVLTNFFLVDTDSIVM